MSFNFIPFNQQNSKEELPIFCELARDLDTLELLVKNGKFYYVSKDEAIKIWVLKALNKETGRYLHTAYSSDYGNEISGLLGGYLKGSLLKSELKRVIEEALLVNPYITRVSDFTFEKKGSLLDVTFVVSTIYGGFLQDLGLESE